ncbi:MAG: hypothetical protein ACYDHD_10365 [Vulcanimicrobiaceae bacterium]
MTGRQAEGYTHPVSGIVWRRAAVWAACVAFAVVLGAPRAARANQGLIDIGSSPVVNVHMRSGILIIRTWQRPQVRIVTGGAAHWTRFSSVEVAGHVPKQLRLPQRSIATRRGPINVPAETFVLPPLSPGEHRGVMIRGYGRTIVTVPAKTALLFLRMSHGRVTVNGYRNGTFVAYVGGGSIHLQRVSGTGFVQILRGPLIAQNSDFTRLRARSAFGNLIFNHCTATQIEATTGLGSVYYNDGSFHPGLARFESQYGDVALGIGSGGADIGVHDSGKPVLSQFGNAAVTTTAHGARARVGGGGAFVTASAPGGRVVLYQGQLQAHPALLRSLHRLPPIVRRNFSMRRPPKRIAPRTRPP